MLNLQCECIELNLQSPTQYFGRFIFKPLPLGQGTTLGNALRRVLLANLKGLSIVGVRIAGVNHEFSTIAGVREDVLDILLNLKEIIFKGEEPITGVGRFKIQGPAVVKAEAFELPANIEIVNADQYIATISDKSFLEMEVELDWGKGYRLADNPNSTISSDSLRLDSVFMPVRQVTYTTEINLSSLTDKNEQLTLDVWTNGSITPTKAVSLAAQDIINWFIPIQNLVDNSKNEVNIKNEINVNQVHISELNLSARASNSLKKAEIETVNQLSTYSIKDLKKIKNFGQKSIDEVVEVLKKRYDILIE